LANLRNCAVSSGHQPDSIILLV